MLNRWFELCSRGLPVILTAASLTLCSISKAHGTEGEQFYVSGKTVEIFDSNSEGVRRVIEVGESSRVVDAIATFNGAVQVTFFNLIRSTLRDHSENGRSVTPEFGFSNPKAERLEFRQRNVGIHIRQVKPDEFKNWGFDVKKEAQLNDNHLWLAFYVQDAGGPMAATQMPKLYPLRHFIGIARFYPLATRPTFDYSRHRQFGEMEELESPEWDATLLFFENIGGHYDLIARAGWQGDPWLAFDWRLLNGEPMFGSYEGRGAGPAPDCQDSLKNRRR